MSKRRVVLYISLGLLLIVGGSVVALYKVGDKILEEIIRSDLSNVSSLAKSNIKDKTPDTHDKSRDSANNTANPTNNTIDTTKNTGQESTQKPAKPVETHEDTGKPKPPAQENPSAGPVSPGGQVPPKATASDPSKPQSSLVKLPESDKIPTEKGIEADKQPKSGTTEKGGIPEDKIKDIKDSVDPADKVRAASLILKRLTPSEISMLMKMAEGGLSQEEKKKAIALVYEKFNEEEIKEIKKMYGKYMN